MTLSRVVSSAPLTSLVDVGHRHTNVKITDSKGSHNYLDSTITVPRNNNFMVAGPKYDGGILILPLSVKY